MNTRAPKPILIIGGGLAGLTLGIGLRREGIPVTIWEAGHYPRHRVCGEFISGSGQRVLEKLELRETVEAVGVHRAETAMFVAETLSGPVHRIAHEAWTLSRFTLDTLLARQFEACGGELRTSSRWKGACGEGVVRASGRRLPGAASEWHWFGLKVHARNLELGADLEMHSLPRAYVGLCRLPDQKVNVCGLFRRAATAHEPDHAEGFHHRPLGGSPDQAWQQILRGSTGTVLHDRLATAVFDSDSFCSVAGLNLESSLGSGSTECQIGDALTMIPPVTGNGMSMALEAAHMAIDPLAAYSRGLVSWTEAQQIVARTCKQAFASRLAWARLLHVLMFAPTIRNRFARVLLGSGLLWRLLFAKTR
jgi:menaquinone-9 beta-reductase